MIDVYKKRIDSLSAQLRVLRKRKDFISWSRLSIIFLLIGVGIYIYPIGALYAIFAGIFLVAVFLRLIILAANNTAVIENINRLISINQEELAIAAGNYTQRSDGSHFLYPTHPYTNDLDIFGRASVYQYINRTQSEQGNTLLAHWLMEPSDAETIPKRQEAVKELAVQYEWRQQLQAYGLGQPITSATEEKVNTWIQEKNTFSDHIGWKLLKWGYPALAITLTILYIIDILPNKWFYIAYVFALGFSSYITKLILPHYQRLDKIVPEIDALSKSAQLIESNTFHSSYLAQQQQRLIDNGISSHIAIKQLKKILERFDANLNIALILFLNPLLLWNLQLIFQLERWRTNNKTKTHQWFAALGEIEAVATLANLHFNHAEWTFPVLDTKQHGTFHAVEMGHPLIPAKKMVRNDFSTNGIAQVTLITGSNMAGKSTFLRSTGVNMVLAMMGAPVCAQRMTLSPMMVISSMRVADNLEESTSTFYAELKKLKSIIERVNNHEKIFVLLDEILRGTNSLDRHTGSKALIKQLIGKHAVAMLATHDVELAQLHADPPSNIHNYHFDAQIANEELYFDYKLKEGVCKSINASLLMKKIGIEL